MAGTSIGKIALDLVVNQGQFNKEMRGITGLAKKAGAALAAAFGVKKLVDFGKQCIELGSDLAEVQNVVDVTFPNMTAQVDEFAKSAAESFGLSETMAKQYTGTFGAMAKAFGFTEQQAYDMGSALTGLTGDVASFYNLSQDEAYTKLKSVFTGETESLKDLGVVMTQTALDAYAMANGFGKTTQEMTEAEKVALRYSFVQSQLSAASGDFARTSDSWANQVRILKLNFDSLKATIGQGLINVFLPVIKVINTLLGKLATLANAFKAFTELITGNKSSGSSGIGSMASDAAAADTGMASAADSADNLADSTSGVGKAAKQAAKEMRALMGFDKINKLSEQSTDSGDAGSGSGGSRGGAGSLGGSAVDFGGLAEGETVVDKLSDKFVKNFENIRKAVQPTIDALKRLWNEGLARLGDFVWTALKDFYEGFLVPVGKWVLGEGLPRLINALNDGLMKTDFGKINDALKRLWDVLAPFAIHVGEGLLWFWENVLVPLGTWTMNEVVPRFLETLANAIDIVNKVIEALQPLFQWFWDSVLLPIAQWTGGVFLQVWDGINSALKGFADWCVANPEKIQNIAIAIGAFFAAWKITQFVSGIAKVMGKISGLMGILESLVAGFNPVIVIIAAVIAIGVLLCKNWDTISAKAKEVWTFVQKKFQQFDNWISGVFTKDWTQCFGRFGNVLNAFSKNVSNICNAVKQVFGGVLNFIAGAFTGDWSRAWNGIRDIFGGIWNSFAAIVKSPINMIIGFLNGLIYAVASCVNSVANMLNGLSIDAPGWVTDLTGITSIGFSLPTWNPGSIPYLAQGGFVKANTPRLAMIGDNRHYGEIVAPEDKMQAMVNAAVKAAAGTGGISKAELESIINNAVMRIVAALASLGFYVDGEEMARAIRTAEQSIDTRFNPVVTK